MVNLAIFASGSGTNAENIIRYFSHKSLIRVTCVCTNRPDALVIEKAKKYEVPVFVFSREDLYTTTRVLDYLKDKKIDWIVLAGFLWLVPGSLLSHFRNRIVNIHPALLPKYGGKGMYGEHVHRAVIANGEKESGISIHFVNPEYDRGNLIFQARCPVFPSDSPESLAARVHELEYRYYPEVIEMIVLGPLPRDT